MLKIRAGEVSDQKIILYDPKSGKESEAVYIPKKVAERLKEYISAKNARTQHFYLTKLPLGFLSKLTNNAVYKSL